MKKIALLATLLLLPSCSTVQTARDALAEMSEADYVILTQRVLNVSTEAGRQLYNVLGEDKADIALTITDELYIAIANDRIDVNDIIQGIVDKYAERLNLTPEVEGYIRDGAKVIDAAVGQIRLGIDGKLSIREKQLILNMLNGLAIGMVT